jgi:hypothetical protein
MEGLMPAGDLTDGNASAAESQRKALVHLNLHSTQLRFLNRLQIEARIRAELGTVNLPSRGISVDAKSPSRKLTVVSHGRVCMVRRLTARKKLETRRQVCANVFVNKGEGVVNGKNVLIAA